MGQLDGNLDLYYEDVYSDCRQPQRIEYARRAEAAALSADPRLKKQRRWQFRRGYGS